MPAGRFSSCRVLYGEDCSGEGLPFDELLWAALMEWSIAAMLAMCIFAKTSAANRKMKFGRGIPQTR